MGITFVMCIGKRPREDMREFEESFSASGGIKRLAYALWLQLWHCDVDDEWGSLLKESRRSGYDGEIFPAVRP